MNPSTGTFISMDSYQGSIYDPVSLHKYLNANANPVMYTDPSGYVGILVAGMGVMTSSEIQEVQNEAIMFNIGMNLLSQLWAIKEVHAITYIATEVILLIAVEDALDGDELQPAMRIAVELLEDALNDIESLCEEAKINSESIAERIKEALYQAKSKGKNPEKGKRVERTKTNQVIKKIREAKIHQQEEIGIRLEKKLMKQPNELVEEKNQDMI